MFVEKEYYGKLKMVELMARYIYLLLVCLLVSSAAIGQTIQGKILDSESGEGLPFANVVLEREGVQKAGTTTDLDGNYVLTGFDPGTYALRVVYVGYQDKLTTGIVVSQSKTVPLDIQMSTGVTMAEIEVVGYKVPLIEPDNTASGSTVTAAEIAKLPTKNVTSVIATTAGVSRSKEGGETSFRGAREGDDIIYVDGVRTRRGSVPAADIEQIQIITGGLPAEYGDVTGGVTNIITKGPSNKFSGSAELETSQFLDAFGYNFANLSLSGPLLKSKSDENERTIIGYRVSGLYTNQKDPNPSYVGGYTATDEFKDRIKATPLGSGEEGTSVLDPLGKYITEDDVEYTKYRPNVRGQNHNVTGKLDFGVTEDVNITVGGNYNWIKNKVINDQRWLFTPETQWDRYETDWRVYLRLRQKIGGASANETDEEMEARTSATVQNINYTIQGDYGNYQRIVEDPNHQDRFWDYGYIGRYEKSYTPDWISTDTSTYVGSYTANVTNFTLGSQNPYGEAIYITNGERGSNRRVSGLHWNLGAVNNLYAKRNRTQYTMTASAGFDLVGKGEEPSKHSLKFGIIYEQRIDRDYSLNPLGLWAVADQRISQQNQLDEDSRVLLPGDSIFVNFEYTDASVFTNNLIDKFGLSRKGEYINLDTYSPDDLSIDMFGADEIVRENSLGMDYYGYDYAGNAVPASTTFNDFFTARENGELTRPVAPVQPIYTAFYLQDKFTFKDLYFNVGLRIDRYDANTKVLKDPYLLRAARTAGEATNMTHAAPVQDNWVVYTVTPEGDQPLAYRDGDQWYDAGGAEVNDPVSIFGGGGIPNPSYTGANIDEENFDPNDVFTDYEPQIDVLPRVSFSFPISDDAGFFAHYDILTRRPTTQNLFSGLDYINFAQRQNVGEIQNPNLKPSKTIDYQVGFQQRVSQSAAITLTAYYREQRDMVAPRTYLFTDMSGVTTYSTFGNRDFGTVKGFTFEYDLRRTKNLRFKFNYTLQFAEGTGSNSTSGRGTATLGATRPIYPFSFDQRHNLIATVDYRYGSGDNYNGPRLFGKNILENFGVNLLMNVGSGRPTSRDDQAGQFTSRGTDGTFNGSRLPWTSRFDIRFDKDIRIGKKDSDKGLDLNVYLTLQNALNTRNVVDVYEFSQSPSDDGFLNTEEGLTAIEDEGGNYELLYRLRLLDQDYYGLPRRIRLGFVVSF